MTEKNRGLVRQSSNGASKAHGGLTTKADPGSALPHLSLGQGRGRQGEGGPDHIIVQAHQLGKPRRDRLHRSWLRVFV